jgi:amidophosphoribosyltransferase
MDGTRRAETGGFVAITGGAACTAVLPEALPGLAHRHGGWAALGVIAGRESAVELRRAGVAQAQQALGGSALRAARGLLAVGRAHELRAPDLLCAGRVDDQPVLACLAGSVHNAAALGQVVAERGALRTGSSDVELLLHLMAQSKQRTLVNRLLEALERTVGAFSLALLAGELLVAARDPRGFRPLWIASRGDAWLAASEPAALEAVGAVGLRELAVGELVLLERGAPVRSLRPWAVFPRAACCLEWLCLSRPGAVFEGLAAHTVRQRLGRALAATSPSPAHLVATLPGGCAAAGMAFAQQVGAPMVQAFDPFPGAGSEPQGVARDRVIAAAVRGQGLALVFAPDTELERLREAVVALRSAGATSVHLRCFGPLQVSECSFGVHLPRPAAGGGLELSALGAWLKADSLAAVGLEGISSALGREGRGFCASCLGADPPLVARDASATPQLPLFEGQGSGTTDARLV